MRADDAPLDDASMSHSLRAPESVAARAVVFEILTRGDVSRAELASRLLLSRPSLSRITRALVEDGLLIEGERIRKGSSGRPSEMLRVNADARYFIGVWVTRDRLYGVVTDLTATVHAAVEVELAGTGADYVIEQIRIVVDRLIENNPRIAAIGISLPGRVSPTSVNGSLLVDSLLLGWYEQDLGPALQDFPRPTTVNNEMHALTAAEHWFGAGVGVQDLAVITIGVEIRVGMVVNGEIATGTHGLTGRLGHMIVDPTGPPCDRGHRGCVSAYLRNEAVVEAAQAPGERLTYSEVIARARRGDVRALRACSLAGYALGVLIATVGNAIDPEKVLLTGDGIELFPLAEDSILRGIQDRSNEPSSVVLDVRSFDFEEWARGAAAYAIRRVWFGRLNG